VAEARDLIIVGWLSAADPNPVSPRAPGRGMLPLLACALLAACAQVPHVAEPPSTAVATTPQIVGSHGPLSAHQAQEVLARLAAQSPDAGALERHVAVEQAVAGSPLTTGNSVTILRDGAETFPAMFAAIRAAQHYIYLEYYIFEDVSDADTHLSELLLQKRAQGVEVALIYDSVGSLSTPSDFWKRLKDAGVQLVQFNPLNPLQASVHYSINDRDHRKILVADGSIAILGGVNLSTAYESGLGASAPGSSGGNAAQQEPGKKPAPEVWHDTDIQIRGPAVPEVEQLFRQHWHDQGGGPLAAQDKTSADAPGHELVRIIGSNGGAVSPHYYATVLSAVRNAETAVWLTAGYFVPTHQEKEDLIHAARRGIDVRLLLPSHSDSGAAMAVQHSHYTELMRAGVKIYERESGVLHSKTIVIDGVWSVVGSSNFDHRSVLFNDEIDAVVLGKDTGKRLQDLYQEQLKTAQPIDLSQWEHRPELERFGEQFWKLWETLL
jgi:cardiolipin synthase